MANVIIKSDERRHQEAAILSQFGGGCERNCRSSRGSVD